MVEQFPIERFRVSAYKIPTDFPESDGTLAWDSTTLILVELFSAGKSGLGYTYGHESVAFLIKDYLAKQVTGKNTLTIGSIWLELYQSIRNLGNTGLGTMAISAIDMAMWDLKAKIIELPLSLLVNAYHTSVPIYGSGGFTSYSIEQLQAQLSGWISEGISRVKIKIGREPKYDLQRVQAAREAIGENAELYVDANGAYTRQQALWFAEAMSDFKVNWFEEPVIAEDLEGLGFIKQRTPAGMEIAAGEYNYNLHDFKNMLEAQAVDVLQADATRCGGFTGFLNAAALSEAAHIPFSSHTAPQLHAHIALAVPNFKTLEYFHDHVRIENMLFDGVLKPKNGALQPDLFRPGLGLEFKRKDAEKYAL